jgi:hypothetical protein
MRYYSKLTILWMVIAIMSCYPIYGVGHDFDKKANFADYMTYDWLPVAPEAWMNSADLEHIKKLVNKHLKAKGREMSEENPDFHIAVQAAKEGKLRVTDYNLLYGKDIPPGKQVYREGALALDFVDTNSKNLIWRGWAKAELVKIKDPEKREKRISAAVAKILENFPPPSSR